MNLLLLNKTEIASGHKAIITGSRQQHISKVLKLGIGDKLKVGIINNLMGTAVITGFTDSNSPSEKIEIQIDMETLKPPPAPIPCKIIMAMPRPKMMRRVIQNLSAMGVKEIYLINSWRVEKSFWQTPWLKPEAIEKQLVLGLEQAMDTVLPSVHIHKRFKPFVEDQLPDILLNTHAMVAHPYGNKPCPVNLQEEPSTLIIGPEGGFTDYEVDLLQKSGAEAVSIGPRILRVETAIPALISRLYPA